MFNHLNMTRRYYQTIDDALDKFVPEIACSQEKIIAAMRYSLQNGGKRVRPILLLETCKMFEHDIDSALPFACAVEMLHTASLIHDDLPSVDNSPIRRGMEACHIKYGENIAIFAGDALISGCFEVVFRNYNRRKYDTYTVMNALIELASAAGAQGIAGGQTIELSYEKDEFSPELMLETYAMKTVALIKSSLAIGGILSGADVASQALLNAYGTKLGLSFQIVDDILDHTGDEKQLGKPASQDQKNNRYTYLDAYGLEKSRLKAEILTEEALEILQQIEEKGRDVGYFRTLTQELLERSR